MVINSTKNNVFYMFSGVEQCVNYVNNNVVLIHMLGRIKQFS